MGGGAPVVDDFWDACICCPLVVAHVPPPLLPALPVASSILPASSVHAPDPSNLGTNSPHALSMALLTSISNSMKSNTTHFISSAFSRLNLSTSRNTRWLHSAYPSLLTFAAAWYRWRDISVEYALASLPGVMRSRWSATSRV